MLFRSFNPETFDRICNEIPGAARWIATDRAEPVTKVFGMGNLFNVWREYAKGDQPQTLNFFAVGDAAIRTNPLYGRGCSLSVMHAHILALLHSHGPRAAEVVPILYGGSCKPDNAQSLFANADVNGGLIGGAALDPGQFTAWIPIACEVKR